MVDSYLEALASEREAQRLANEKKEGVLLARVHPVLAAVIGDPAETGKADDDPRQDVLEEDVKGHCWLPQQRPRQRAKAYSFMFPSFDEEISCLAARARNPDRVRP